MNQRDELDELLSAYVDGELVGDERSRVRAALAEDDDNPRVVEELEVLHASIQEFPRERLGSDFKDQVLAKIDAGRPASRSDHRTRTAALATLAALAAALFLMWLLVWRNGGDAEVTQPENNGRTQPVNKDGKTRVEPKKAVAKKDGKAKSPIGIAKDNQQPGTRKKTTPPDSGKTNPLVASKDGKKKKKGPAIQPGLPSQYLMTIELVVTPQGLEQQRFRNILDKHQVSYMPSLKVARSLETQLLKSRFLEGVGREKTADDPSQVELVYVILDPDRLDPMWKDLRGAPKLISHMKFDMALMPSEMKIFEMLRQREAANFAQMVRQKKAAADRLNRARKLMMSIALWSELSAISTMGKLDLAPPTKSPFSKSRSVGKKKGADHDIPNRDKPAQILFILHHAR